MPSASGPPYLSEAEFLEHGYEAHEPIARRLWIDRICFQNVRTMTTCEFHRGENKLLADA